MTSDSDPLRATRIQIYEAIHASDLDGLKELFREHPEMIHYRYDDSDNWLSSAAGYSNLDVVKFLVDKGLDINFGGSYHKPIGVAISRGNYDIAVYLLKQGASLELKEFCYRQFLPRPMRLSSSSCWWKTAWMSINVGAPASRTMSPRPGSTPSLTPSTSASRTLSNICTPMVR